MFATMKALNFDRFIVLVLVREGCSRGTEEKLTCWLVVASSSHSSNSTVSSFEKQCLSDDVLQTTAGSLSNKLLFEFCFGKKIQNSIFVFIKTKTTSL